MGYSYTAKAGFTLEAIGKLINRPSSNEMPDGGFYETGREQADGAITGTVWKPHGVGHVTKRGSFRIAPDGTVKRFPGLPAPLLRQAEQHGASRYAGIHGTWRERGASLLDTMESGKAVDRDNTWNWFQDIFGKWQREKGYMFAVMPAGTNEAISEALRDMLSDN